LAAAASTSSLRPQGLEPLVQVRSRIRRQEVCDRGARELAPDDGRTLEHEPLRGVEALDARGEERVDRRRHLEIRHGDADGPALAFAPQDTVVHEHAHELPYVERVALAGGEHAARHRRRQRVRADHARGEPSGGAGIEPAERHDVVDERALPRERRPRVAQLGSGGEHHEERRARAPLHEVLHQIQEQRVRPLHVVERERDGPFAREGREDSPDEDERLLRGGGESRREEGRRRPRRTGRRGGPQRLDDRREGGAAACVAAGREHASAPGEAPLELREEARLAEAGRAQDDREARARRARRIVQREQAAQLVGPTDERRRSDVGRAVERHDTERRPRPPCAP
jgi:hypothetical protein